VCFHLFLQTLLESFLILKRIQEDIIINVHVSVYLVPALRDRFQSNIHFLHRFLFNSPILHNNPSNRSRYFHIGSVEGQTEHNPKHEETLIFGVLQNVNIATRWISMFMLFLVAVKVICVI
jgi:hypothetical protein